MLKVVLESTRKTLSWEIECYSISHFYIFSNFCNNQKNWLIYVPEYLKIFCSSQRLFNHTRWSVCFSKRSEGIKFSGDEIISQMPASLPHAILVICRLQSGAVSITIWHFIVHVNFKKTRTVAENFSYHGFKINGLCHFILQITSNGKSS